MNTRGLLIEKLFSSRGSCDPCRTQGIRLRLSLTVMAEQVRPRPFTSSHAAGAAAVRASGARRQTAPPARGARRRRARVRRSLLGRSPARAVHPAGCAQDAAGPPGSPPIEDLPEMGGGPGPGGLVKERPKGSVKLFVGQIGREMDADGYGQRLFRRRACAGPARTRACVRVPGPAWDGRLMRGGTRLRSLLEPHGEVHDSSIIKDRATGQSKGTVHARACTLINGWRGCRHRHACTDREKTQQPH